MTAAYWALRAEESRAMASLMKDPGAKATMEKIVKDYERLAVLASAREQWNKYT